MSAMLEQNAETPLSAPEQRDDYAEWGGRLSDYAARLRNAGEATLANAVARHAAHIEAIRIGDAPESAAAAPADLDPRMVGQALARGGRAVESFVELVRNVLIFMPVFVTWLKISRSGVNDLGDMQGTAVLVIVLVIALIATHVGLGLMRRRRSDRADRIAREFAGTLAGAALVGATRRSDNAEQAIASFAQAGGNLSKTLQEAGDRVFGMSEVARRQGEELRERIAEMTEAAERQGEQLREQAAAMAAAADRQAEQLHQQAERMIAAVERQTADVRSAIEEQGRRVDDLASLLRPISEIGGQLVDTQRALADVARTVERAAGALGDIQGDLSPASDKLAETVRDLKELTDQLEETGRHTQHMTNVFAESVQPMARSWQTFDEAVKSLNAVLGRALEEIERMRGTGGP